MRELTLRDSLSACRAACVLRLYIDVIAVSLPWSSGSALRALSSASRNFGLLFSKAISCVVIGRAVLEVFELSTVAVILLKCFLIFILHLAFGYNMYLIEMVVICNIINNFDVCGKLSEAN